MGKLMLEIVTLIARVHDRILAFNAALGMGLTDKQLHFLSTGLLGIVLFALLFFPVRALVRRGRTAALVWLCALLGVLVFSFAVEIGQYETRTGVLEVADIAYGLLGFLAFSALWTLIRWLVLLMRRK